MDLLSGLCGPLASDPVHDVAFPDLLSGTVCCSTRPLFGILSLLFGAVSHQPEPASFDHKHGVQLYVLHPSYFQIHFQP